MEKLLSEEEVSRQSTPSDTVAKLRRNLRNRESHDDLAELESELRRAYIAKELRMQLVERETERFIENVRKQHTAKVQRLTQQAVLEDSRREKLRGQQECEDYRRDLTRQIKLKEEEKAVMLEEARHEREILAEIDRIREECERSKQVAMKVDLIESMRRERLILQEMRSIRHQEALEAEARKDYQDEKYLDELETRQNQAAKLRKERMENREKTVCEIAKILINMEDEKKQKELLLEELIGEEVRFELLLREEEETAKRKRMKEELTVGLKEQMVFTEECKLRFVKQDRAFAEEIMRKIIEDERTARLTAEARRRMQAQYREDLTKLIEIRCRIREEEMSRMVEERREESRCREMEFERVREDRKRLLQQHAANVAGFLNTSELSEAERKIIEQYV